MQGFWLAEEITELAGEPTGCGELARGGCSSASNFGVTKPTGTHGDGEKD